MIKSNIIHTSQSIVEPSPATLSCCSHLPPTRKCYLLAPASPFAYSILIPTLRLLLPAGFLSNLLLLPSPPTYHSNVRRTTVNSNLPIFSHKFSSFTDFAGTVKIFSLFCRHVWRLLRVEPLTGSDSAWVKKQCYLSWYRWGQSTRSSFNYLPYRRYVTVLYGICYVLSYRVRSPGTNLQHLVVVPDHLIIEWYPICL